MILSFRLRNSLLTCSKNLNYPCLEQVNIAYVPLKISINNASLTGINRALQVFVGEIYHFLWACECFPDSSVGKESACNAGDPSLIPGSGRFPGEGIGYPLQYSWASLVAQLVKNMPAMLETWHQSLHCEDPLEKGKATHSSILAWRIP